MSFVSVDIPGRILAQVRRQATPAESQAGGVESPYPWKRLGDTFGFQDDVSESLTDLYPFRDHFHRRTCRF